MAYIYKITNLINDKIYIGKTNRTIEERFKEHCNEYKKERSEKRPLYNAMNKYGIENFKIEQIEECSLEESSDKEKYWIEYYGSFKYGYNATIGGDGKSYVDRELVVKTYNEVQNRTEVSKILEIDIKTVGHILKDEFNISVKSSQEISKEKNSKAVAMLDKNTNKVLKTFPSIRDAERYFNIDYRTHISQVCDGKRKTCRGYKWKWL